MFCCVVTGAGTWIRNQRYRYSGRQALDMGYWRLWMQRMRFGLGTGMTTARLFPVTLPGSLASPANLLVKSNILHILRQNIQCSYLPTYLPGSIIKLEFSLSALCRMKKTESTTSSRRRGNINLNYSNKQQNYLS